MAYIDKLKERLNDKRNQKDELVQKSQESTDVEEVKGIEESLEAVQEDIDELEKEIQELEKTETDEENRSEDEPGNQEETEKNDGEENKRSVDFTPREKQLRKIASYGNGAKNLRGDNMENKELEIRAQEFAKTKTLKFDTAEARALLISSGKIATPTKVEGIVDNFNEVSSIVDLVDVQDCEGMGADKIAYKKSSSKGSVKGEGTKNSTATGMTTEYVEITPETLSTYDEISRETTKQTPLKYKAKVDESARIGLRRAASEKIVKSIAKSKTIDEKVEIANIDHTTLRKIALNYGGDLEVGGGAYLFLTKADLIAFGDVRGTNEKKAVYEITPDQNNSNVGTIKDGGLAVRYCLNSDLTKFDAATAGGTEDENPVMLYGNPKTVRLDLFGAYDVRASEDYKFAEGLIAVMGEVMCGCDVTKYNGMLRIYKKSST